MMTHDSSAPKLRLACTTEDSEKDELLEFGKKYGLLGESPALLTLLKELRTFAPIPYAILLLGETGTGKELAARALHGERFGPFLPFNCGGMRGDVGDAVFTGYRRGSFTGATTTTDRHGAFVNGRDGTVFLDEIQLLTEEQQGLFLRVLETKRILPAGDTQEVDVSTTRLVAASNEDIATLVRERKFRKDLYHRINIIVVHLPPLRERREDIALLAQHFVGIHREEFDSPAETISDDALALLTAHSWPGNVRELKHTIMGILARKRDGDCIEASDLPPLIAIAPNHPVDQDPLLFQYRFSTFPTLKDALRAMERLTIQRAFQISGSKHDVEKLLGIAKPTLNRKIIEYDIRLEKKMAHHEEP